MIKCHRGEMADTWDFNFFVYIINMNNTYMSDKYFKRKN
jgi:hypothetical protein